MHASAAAWSSSQDYQREGMTRVRAKRGRADNGVPDNDLQTDDDSVLLKEKRGR